MAKPFNDWFDIFLFLMRQCICGLRQFDISANIVKINQ